MSWSISEYTNKSNASSYWHSESKPFIKTTFSEIHMILVSKPYEYFPYLHVIYRLLSKIYYFSDNGIWTNLGTECYIAIQCACNLDKISLSQNSLTIILNASARTLKLQAPIVCFRKDSSAQITTIEGDDEYRWEKERIKYTYINVYQCIWYVYKCLQIHI